MAYTLYYHPLSSYCMKVVTALYESGTPFTPKSVNLQDGAERAALLKLYPVGKFPVLRDDDRDLTVPESTIIIEHLAQHHPTAAALVPGDPGLALQVRAQDRFFDLHVHTQMQAIVGDRLRPKDAKDPHGVEQARAQIRKSYDILERQITGAWAMGENFGLAECAAAPPLFYASQLEPFGDRSNLTAYLARLKARPSFARVLKEPEPHFAMFPKEDA